jgi:hypothetical protein
MDVTSRAESLREKYGPWLTTFEVAREAGIAPATLRQYAFNGYAPRAEQKIGKSGFYSPEVAALWIADRAECKRQRPELYVRRVVAP